MQQALLRSLASDGCFCDSQEILRTANAWYRNTLTWVETDLGFADRPNALCRSLDAMPPADRCFVLRSAPVRSTIDEIASKLFRGSQDAFRADLIQLYEKLCNTLAVQAAKANQRATDTHWSKWQEAGYDVRAVIAEPFPYLTSAWVGSRECDDTDATAWDEAREVERLFESHMASSVGAEQCVLRPMSAANISQMEKALEFLNEFSSPVARDIAINVRHFCLIDFARWSVMSSSDYREIAQSVSSHLIPSVCFLSTYSLSNMSLLIEALYHEALHKKLSNLIYSRHILKDYYDALTAPRFCSYWNQDTQWNSNQWEFDRALYAFHLYVHLTVFYGVLLEGEEQNELPRSWCADRREKSIERGKAIGKWLLQTADTCMGADGRPFLNTMTNLLDASIAVPVRNAA
jgi:hypothetical protein